MQPAAIEVSAATPAAVLGENTVIANTPKGSVTGTAGKAGKKKGLPAPIRKAMEQLKAKAPLAVDHTTPQAEVCGAYEGAPLSYCLAVRCTLTLLLSSCACRSQQW